MSNHKAQINILSGETSVVDLEKVQFLDKVPTGFYKVCSTSSFFGTRYWMEKVEVVLPTTVDITVESIIDKEEIEIQFSEKKIAICKSLNVNNKLSYLLHGKQGSGKTTTLLGIANFFIKNYEALAVIVTSEDDINFATEWFKSVSVLQEVIPVFILDECESEFRSEETFYKSFLDGVASPQNMIFLAATNYFKVIPETISKRPSRFKHVIQIDNMDQTLTLTTFVNGLNSALDEKFRLSDEEITAFVKSNKNKTIDELKNLFMDKLMMTEKSSVGAIRKKSFLGM